ncbi:MAG TPA: hypothetical protein VGX16_07695 [Solirubrobacteraceae bacterium]|nr:hypothetical protein [Solirubrobacteraceae bacterium]
MSSAPTEAGGSSGFGGWSSPSNGDGTSRELSGAEADRPEIAVGAAFAGGLFAALLLRRRRRS